MKPERLAVIEAEFASSDAGAELSDFWHEAVGELIHGLRNAHHAAQCAQMLAMGRKKKLEELQKASGPVLMRKLHEGLHERDALRRERERVIEALRELATPSGVLAAGMSAQTLVGKLRARAAALLQEMGVA